MISWMDGSMHFWLNLLYIREVTSRIYQFWCWNMQHFIDAQVRYSELEGKQVQFGLMKILVLIKNTKKKNDDDNDHRINDGN